MLYNVIIKYIGGIMMTVYIIFSIMLFIVAFQTGHLLFCFLLWLYISAIYLPCLWHASSHSYKEEVRKQEEYDNEWGIIEHRDKDK